MQKARFRQWKSLLAGVTAVSLASTPVAASIVTFEFEAVISHVSTEVFLEPTLIDGPGGINIGDPVSGFFTFDSDQIPYYFYSGNGAVYRQLGIFATLAGKTWAGPGNEIDIINNYQPDLFSPFYEDEFIASTQTLYGPSINGQAPNAMGVSLYDSATGGNPDGVSDLNLPTTPYDLSLFDGSTFEINFIGPNALGDLVTSYAWGGLTSLSRVDEPSPFLLLGLGILLIGGITRIRPTERLA